MTNATTVNATTVQYRDSQTEEVLERRYEEETPRIGESVHIGFDDYRVLYRWRTVPTCCIVYVHRESRQRRRSQSVAA